MIAFPMFILIAMKKEEEEETINETNIKIRKVTSFDFGISAKIRDTSSIDCITHYTYDTKSQSKVQLNIPESDIDFK